EECAGEAHSLVVRSAPLDQNVTRHGFEQIFARASDQRGVPRISTRAADIAGERVANLGRLEIIEQRGSKHAIDVELVALRAERLLYVAQGLLANECGRRRSEATAGADGVDQERDELRTRCRFGVDRVCQNRSNTLQL